MNKPLFIPLKREFYEAFVDGTKSKEYRKLGPRWNNRTCRVGREVTISLGYGKANRRAGIITNFTVNQNPNELPGWVECYGPNESPAAVIHIKLSPPIEANR